MIAEVAFNLPMERTFHYLIPPDLEAALQPGMRVIGPFGPRQRVGVVVRRVARSPVRELKAIRRVLDPMPVISGERWALARWLAGYYACSLGEALFAMVPADLRLARAWPQASAGGPPASSAEAADSDNPVLSGSQRDALDAILAALVPSERSESRDDAPPGRSARSILVHGVTGSGKTELYLRAIEHTLAQGRSAICLVPEIALTPQTIDRFRARFEDRVAVWHSRLTSSRRAEAWCRISLGRSPVVVGTRSAIFSPVPRLGLVILDEEHEPTYKQESVPRYHAREVALERARLAGGLVVLGSATPSVEAFYAASRRPGGLVTLPERITGRALPAVEVVDLREGFAARRRSGPLSDRLRLALQQVVDRGEQAMLLLNRRGFARVAQCQVCGAITRCRRCGVPLIYHASRRALVCHYCNLQQPPEELCGQCRKGPIRFRGTGTERVESELHRLFPAAAIARMDRDTTGSAGSHRRFYEAMRDRQVSLLVGTQMIAKGLDFPEVTLVGVVSADTALNLPDFRAGERTFDLLTQMAGRAGRGGQPGRVLIQTYCPSHYAIQAASRHDYHRFYAEEIRMRRRLRLPPFVHLIELTVIGGSQPRAAETAARLAERVRRAARPRRVTLLGPAPHRIPRLRGAYRMSLILKGRTVEPMVEMLRTVLGPGRKFGGLPVLVNVDPL